ncbi:S-adenosyl-L-methionine-dependent methyltransferase [Hypoxylon trugodes]|uniref:S-adenosyl-L-methionine-dependent methyltransferase n=1 Tax=Hypoxylon trugodes TaxID=326681 RepID=UPI00219280B6|nr:S-adenosyl-L-methionine-dependent methyltransferase [Hypoxylon trugodes]KAI1387569.1 S-adenosyl-L-methionine-dependent methyltransferase [Hypoxylon trugodes]
MASPNRIVELSSLIAKETAVIDGFLTRNQLPTPSLDAYALKSIPIPEEATEIHTARRALIEACSELKALMTGPKDLLKFDWTAFVSVKAALRFKLDRSFAVGDSTTFEDMAEFSGLNVRNVRRIVRHAILNHYFFQEAQPNVITHSGLTAVLAEDEVARNSLIVELDEFWPAGVKLADALEKWPNSEEDNETGFSLANNSNKGMYEILAENPARQERFALYFANPDKTADGIFDNYPWTNVSSMVDIGGSLGSVAIGIAQRFPNVKCVVQDLPNTIAEAESRLPVELRDRVTFMAHDFFTEQPVSADVYFFRSIFHNWADKYCIRILENLVPALKPGAKVVIHERMLPGLESLTTMDARRAINTDIGMQQLLNAQQREMHEWPELFRKADSRFRYIGAKKPTGSIRWIIEAEWQG